MVGKRSAAKFAVGFALVVSSAAAVWAAAGALDTTFDGDGVAATTAFGQGGSLVDCAVQADGKVIGTGNVAIGPQAYYAWKIGRWNADGSLDTSYGVGGFRSVFDSGIGGELHSVALDGSGRAVAVGGYSVPVTSRKTTTYDPHVAVVRLTTSGALDTSFGSGGAATFTVPGAENPYALSVVIQPDGKIVVAGNAAVTKKGNTQGAVFVARLNANGTLDSTFGTAGITLHDVTSGHDDVGRGCLALQSSGRLVVASRHSVVVGNVSYSAGALVRFQSNGAVDTAFGVVRSPNAPYDDFRGIAADGSDRIVAVGLRVTAGGVGDTNMLAVRFTSGGALDTSFGTGGFAVLDTSSTGSVESLYSVAIASDGRIVGGGWLQTGLGTDAVVVRLNSDGSADSTFGSGGAAAPLATGWSAIGTSIGADGKIVIAASEAIDGTRYGFLARYLSN